MPPPQVGSALAAIAILAAGCTTPQQMADEAMSQAMEPHKAAFCAMTPKQRDAYILRRVEKANADAVYMGGKWRDATFVTSRELAAERVAWRKGTGC